jgi:hypothetical protein
VRRRGSNREQQRGREKKTAERGKNLCMGMTVHAEHAINENSWIA